VIEHKKCNNEVTGASFLLWRIVLMMMMIMVSSFTRPFFFFDNVFSWMDNYNHSLWRCQNSLNCFACFFHRHLHGASGIVYEESSWAENGSRRIFGTLKDSLSFLFPEATIVLKWFNTEIFKEITRICRNQKHLQDLGFLLLTKLALWNLLTKTRSPPTKG